MKIEPGEIIVHQDDTPSRTQLLMLWTLYLEQRPSLTDRERELFVE